MKIFLILWFGQLVSVFGSALTGFALGVWVYERTGSATLFALISFAITLPRVVSLPFAGAMVDRFDRRRLMIASHAGSALCSVGLLLLACQEATWIAPLMVLMALSTAFAAVQWPAMSASTPILVPTEQLGRVSGLLQVGPAAVLIVAPLLGGLLFHRVGLSGVVLIDLLTFVCAIVTLLAIRLPQPPRSERSTAVEAGAISLWQESMAGWACLRREKGLWALLLLFATTNFTLGALQVLIGPLILGMASPVVYGNVMAVWAVGGLVGSLGLAAWGGPERRVRAILGFLVFQGSILFLGGLRPHIGLISVAGFFFLASQPLINGCSQVIWMRKVPFEIQGRVFSFRRMVAWSSLPLAQLLAGPLAELVFEPLMAEGGGLAGSVGRLIGVGPGRGIGLLLMALGALVLVAVVIGAGYRPLLEVEDDLPDAVGDGPWTGRRETREEATAAPAADRPADPPPASPQ